MTPAQLINQNSFTLAALFLLAIFLLVLWRVRPRKIALALFLAAALILIAANFFLRVGGSEIESTTQFEDILATHQPLVLEIYSNY